VSVMVVCSAEAATKRRMKRIAKKEKGGGGKPAMELPNSSMPAQEQAKKKENEVHHCGSVLFQSAEWQLTKLCSHSMRSPPALTASECRQPLDRRHWQVSCISGIRGFLHLYSCWQ
jgi:hypothetical protein